MFVSLFRRCLDDFGARERGERYGGIDVVIRYLPTPTDDAPHRIIQPRRGAAYLDFLMSWQPEASAYQTILENDEDILEVFVQECDAREAEGHADDLRVVLVDVNGADDSRLPIILGPDLDFIDVDRAPRDLDAQRIR